MVKRPWNDTRYFFAAPTRDQAKRIAWQDLKDLVRELMPGNIASISETELMIKTHDGAELHIVGMDKPQRVEGVGWDGGVLDECSDLKPKAFDLSIYPALADRNGWCWFIGVPKRMGPGATEYKERFRRSLSGEDPSMAGFTWPASDILPAEAIEHARQTLDPKDFREQFEASFETAGGGVYYCFDKEYNVRPCSYDNAKPILVGSDFNVDPMAWVLIHSHTGPRLEIFDELHLRDTNTQAALDVLYQRYKDHKGGFQFYGDATGKARKTSATLSDYQIILDDERFKKLGRTVHYPKANPARADRYAAVNAMLCNAAGDRRLFTDPHNKYLNDDFEAAYFKPGTREAAEGGDLTHPTDALGYVVHYLFPVGKFELPTGQFSVRVA